MKLDQLQYFVETARRQHIGQAALFLSISPSAISHSIAALEEEFGKALFQKQGRQIKLTHHGKIFLERAEFLLNEIRLIHEELSADQIELRGHYRIAATHLFCSDILAPAWMKLQTKHQGLSSTIQSLKSGEVLAKVNSGEIDLGFCLSSHSGPNHEQEIIHEGRLVMSFGKKHPFLKNRKIEELNKYPVCMALAAQGIENCENHPSFQKIGITPKVSLSYDNYDVAIQVLKFNTTWSLLPDFIANNCRSEIETYIPKAWEADYKIVALWPKYRIKTKVIDQIIENVKMQLKSESKGK